MGLVIKYGINDIEELLPEVGPFQGVDVGDLKCLNTDCPRYHNYDKNDSDGLWFDCLKADAIAGYPAIRYSQTTLEKKNEVKRFVLGCPDYRGKGKGE